MPAIHIRNITEGTLSRLKKSAEYNKRSLQGEVLFLLERAAEVVPHKAYPEPLELFTISSPEVSHQAWNREEIYGTDGR